MLGVSGGDSMRIEFNVTGSGVLTETWANASESSVGTYQFAVIPEPGTAMLLVGGLLALVGVRRKLTA
ncbi:MAG: PEP-CTERM sorting domain-containing protein [Kiritimatiellae bacterium]|nr:PEP-CTERM sorting domain-containing protein [Kiritimatiellia bacterium]